MGKTTGGNSENSQKGNSKNSSFKKGMHRNRRPMKPHKEGFKWKNNRRNLSAVKVEMKDGVEIKDYGTMSADQAKKNRSWKPRRDDVKWKKNGGQWTAVKLERNKGYEMENGSMRKRPKKFPGRKALDPKLKEKYTRGEGVDVKYIRNPKHAVLKTKLERREKKIIEAEEETARAEVLLTESSGLMETEDGTRTSHITQTDIKNAVDITTASKGFELNLREFGPYKMQFTRNGRHLLLGGRKGHLASLDWVTKKLHYEINTMESIHDVCWLHTEQMMAVAQKSWVYIYDNDGTELHCLKKMNRTEKLEFLPYHFLLCGGQESGHLNWVDITLGKEMLCVFTKKGRLEIMRQNPYNAVICCGHANGTVSMWTPNCDTAVASVLCHSQSVRAIEFDAAGRNFVTAGLNKEIKLWDARNLGDSIYKYRLRSEVSTLSFSQKQLLAVGTGNVVEVYDKVMTGGMKVPYMHYRCKNEITGMQFCPYEDILGVSTYRGYSSLIIPGAGEPNFDALELNPFMSVSGRRETEVKNLLAKLPHELITLDPISISQVDVPRLEEKLEAKRALQYIKTPKIDVVPRYRMKGKSGSAQKFKRKQMTMDALKRNYIRDAVVKRDELGLANKKSKKVKNPKILDRFSGKVQG